MCFHCFFAVIYTRSRKKAIQAAEPLVTGRQRDLINEGKFYRQVSYPKGDITDVAYFLQEQGKGEMEAYFNAFLLKWLRDGQIKQIKDPNSEKEILN